MDISVIIFSTSAVVTFVLLSVFILLNILRKRYLKHYDKIRERDKQTSALHFVVPTYVPKAKKVALHQRNDSVIDTNDETIDEDMIDPQLYKNADDEASDISPTTPGRLCFSVKYEIETERLIVGLLRGQRIRPRTSNPIATPYVKVCLLPDKRKKLQTKARQKTPHPLFNEEFIFYCPLLELKERCLKFTVCDFDRFSRQNNIGKVLFSLEEYYDEILTDSGCDEIWRDIEDCINCDIDVCHLKNIKGIANK